MPHLTRVVITRPQDQALSLANDLRDRGLTPLFYPGLAFAPCSDVMFLDADLAKMAAGRYDMMILTSGQAARIVSDRLAALEIALSGQMVWTVGRHTAASCHFDADLYTPDEAHDALSLLVALPDMHGKRILLPQSPLASPTLREGLMARGAHVTVVHPYEVVPGVGGDDVPDYIRRGLIRAFTFFSGSAVEGVIARLETEHIAITDIEQIPAICFGRQTAAAARAMGLSVWEGNATYDTFYTLLERATKEKRAAM